MKPFVCVWTGVVLFLGHYTGQVQYSGKLDMPKPIYDASKEKLPVNDLLMSKAKAGGKEEKKAKTNGVTSDNFNY